MTVRDAREWALRLERLERAIWKGEIYARDVALSDIAAIRAEVTGMEAALEAFQRQADLCPRK